MGLALFLIPSSPSTGKERGTSTLSRCATPEREANGKEQKVLSHGQCAQADVTGSIAKSKTKSGSGSAGGGSGQGGGAFGDLGPDPVETRPGWGNGDTNHIHTGPPGQQASHEPPGQTKNDPPGQAKKD